MGNKASNMKAEVSKCDSFVRYGHLAMTKSDWTKNNSNNNMNTTGDFLMTKDDPRNWSPNDLTPSRIVLLTSSFQCPKAPPPTTKQSDTTTGSQSVKKNGRLSSSMTSEGQCDGRHPAELHPSKIGDCDNRLAMTPLLFLRTSCNNNNNNNQSGGEVVNLINKKSSSTLHHRHRSKLDQGDDESVFLIQEKSSSSVASAAVQPKNYKPPWLPNVRTSEAKTNLQKKSLKSSIFRFGGGGQKRWSSSQKISSSFSSKLKFSLNNSKKSKQNIRSRSLTLKKSLEKYLQNNNNHTSSSSSNLNSPPPEQTGTQNNKMDIVTVKRPPVPNQRPRSKNSSSKSYEYTYEYTYSSKSSVMTPEEEKNPRKQEEAKKIVDSGAATSLSGGRTTTTTSGTGTSRSNSKGRGGGGGGGGKKLTASDLSKTESYRTSTTYENSGESGVNSGRGSSPTMPTQKIRPRPKKKIPPPPVFISDYGGSSSGKKKQETPADRLKNVDIVEELCYNCPDDDGHGDNGNCTCCTLDYYCCCNECGEIELVPQCCCTPSKKEKNPVKYCRRQRFNFDDGKDKNECPDGPPFCWEDRPSNPYDEIPVGKNPIMGVSCSDPSSGSSYVCCDPSTVVVEKNCGTDNKQVLPSESGTYFFDAERRCFVPVVEVREPPPPPPPEVVDEIIEEEPILTNIEPIIQPVIQSMGGGGGCGPCGPCGSCGPCGMPTCGCPMPFFPQGGCMMPAPSSEHTTSEQSHGKKKKEGSKKNKEKTDENTNSQTMENLGMMGLCGMNMNGLANMGPYGTIAMPIMKYNHKPPTPPCPPCMPPCPCRPDCPCGPCPCQPPYQPMTNCCNPVCFPGYSSCPYPMYCNPGAMCCNSKEKKKKKKKGNKNSGENFSVQTSTTADASSGPSRSTRNYHDEDDEDD